MYPEIKPDMNLRVTKIENLLIFLLFLSFCIKSRLFILVKGRC